jgi:hypothetical protein
MSMKFNFSTWATRPKLNEIKGDPGSVQREINNFRGLIRAAEEWLSKNP